MAISISSISKLIHRYNSTHGNPVITTAGHSSNSNFRRIFISDHLYDTYGNPYTWNPKNRSGIFAVNVRTLSNDTPTLDGISDIAVAPEYNHFTKTTGGDGFTGATFANVASGPVSLEGYPAVSANAAYTLQSGTPTYNFLDPICEHALILGRNGGDGYILENGVAKLNFKYDDTGDGGLIEYRNGIVRYYLIKADKTPVLLRAKRSTLTYPIKPVFVLTNVGGISYNTLVFLGDEASQNVEIVSVLDGEFQDLQNQQQIESLADRVVMKDKREEFTYTSSQKQVITLPIALEWRFESEYQEFKEFFQYHDISKPFIFVDNSRTKIFSNENISGIADNEMVAKFSSAWKDNPLGAGLYGVSVDIKQEVNPQSYQFYI